MEENIIDKVYEATECKIKEIMEEGLNQGTVDYLGKVIDIHKDLSNEKYWKVKEDNMRYRGSYRESGNYGNFDNYRGNYGRRNYGARGYDTKYRGQEVLDDMYQSYQDYEEGKEMYGNDQDTLKSFQYMLKAFKDYYKHLKQEATSQEEIEMLEDTAREMLEM